MQNKIDKKKLSKVPSINDLIAKYGNLYPSIPYELLKDTIKKTISLVKKEIIADSVNGSLREHINDKMISSLSDKSKNSLYKVINGTGIVLHTGLGRAPISRKIINDSIESVEYYSNLEHDVSINKRGDRNSHITYLINSMLGCESSIIVNNNAAAVLLMLNSICEGKEVIISRGQLVEIGGSFRIPDVIKKSNSEMVEIGTTNKTHLNDYSNAISSNTGSILYAHTSNYKIIGFTNEVKIDELIKLSKTKRRPILIDLGSGELMDYSSLDIANNIPISKYVKMGASAISFSGDKLIGGPQCGIICGKKRYIDKMKRNSLYRALRCDKFTISLMENTLRTIYNYSTVNKYNFTYSLLNRSNKDLYKMGKKIISQVESKIIEKYNINLINSKVEAGSGSLPTKEISSWAIVFNDSAKEISEKLRKIRPSVLGYIRKNKYYIDLKAIPQEDSKILVSLLNKVL